MQSRIISRGLLLVSGFALGWVVCFWQAFGHQITEAGHPSDATTMQLTLSNALWAEHACVDMVSRGGAPIATCSTLVAATNKAAQDYNQAQMAFIKQSH